MSSGNLIFLFDVYLMSVLGRTIPKNWTRSDVGITHRTNYNTGTGVLETRFYGHNRMDEDNTVSSGTSHSRPTIQVIKI